ncbi:MAG: condensation domain-containing protein, partial [Clostridia bacterium]|nr:condensation domain-containing protein [Clostridia bacterium]
MSEITYYPLTQSQYLILFQMKFCVKKEISNICTEIEFLEDVDQKLLMQSLYLGMLRAPAMSVRLHTTEDKKIVQYFSDAAHEKIDYIDMSGKSDEEYEALLNKWNTAAFPNKCMETQLYNLKLLKKPNGNLAVYGCYSHLVSDAYAIMATFKDILNIYNALRDGKALPSAPVSPLPAYQADYKYFNSEKMEADRKYYDEVVFDTEPQFTTIAGKDAKIFAKDHKQGHKYGTFAYNPLMPGAALNLPIDKDLNDKITEFALNNKVSPAALYALATRTYLSAVCETNDVTFMNPVARRATVAQKRAGGTLTMPVALRTRFSNDLTFIEGCKEVYKAQCEAY